MPKWLVRLKGERFDLEDLPQLLCSSELSIIEENNAFYLRSSKFDSLTSLDDVHERASAFIKIINSVAKFYRQDFLEVSEDVITRIDDDDKRQHYVSLEGTIIPRGKVSAQPTVTTANETEQVTTQPSQLQSLLELAQKHKVIADALSFYRDDAWISLYKVYEIIRDDVGGTPRLLKQSWVADAEISRFTQTAQSRAALGDSARHASEKYHAPSQPMTISEARTLIHTILSRWVSSK